MVKQFNLYFIKNFYIIMSGEKQVSSIPVYLAPILESNSF